MSATLQQEQDFNCDEQQDTKEHDSSIPMTNNDTTLISSSIRKVGYIYEERFMWHEPRIVAPTHLLQPFQHWEDSETKRRFHNLLLASKLYDKLIHLQPIQSASKDILTLVHTLDYIQDVEEKSKRLEGYTDRETIFPQFTYDVASLAVGATIKAVDEVMQNTVDSVYALLRPPGHHATPCEGMGFCIFNNVAIAAKHLLQTYPDQVAKVAIVDYDVHHGNGTQNAFYDDNLVLYISIHQDSNYPLHSGNIDEDGVKEGNGYTINIPLPPGSGSGAYKHAFETIVIPALYRFNPDFILVSSGFDASYADPLSAMILCSEDFHFMASSLIHAASSLCENRIVFLHEGGYSADYVPFCGVAVIEALIGLERKDCIDDPYLGEVKNWGGQKLQEHQWKIIDCVALQHGLTRSEFASGL